MRRLLLVASIVLPGAALAEPNPYLREAKILYDEFSFDACAQRLELAAKWPSTSGELVEVSLYAALCSYNLNRLDDARSHFRTAVRLDPNVELPAMTSPKVRQFFEAVPRPAVRPAEPPAPVAPAPVALAPTPVVQPPAAPPAAVEPAAPTGRSTGARVAAVVLTMLTAAALGTTVGLGINAQRLAVAANGSTFDSDRARLGADAYARATQTNIGWGVTAVLAVAAMVWWVLQW